MNARNIFIIPEPEGDKRMKQKPKQYLVLLYMKLNDRFVFFLTKCHQNTNLPKEGGTAESAHLPRYMCGGGSTRPCILAPWARNLRLHGGFTELLCAAAQFDTLFSSNRIQCELQSNYKQSLVGLSVVLSPCPTPSFWSCPTLPATTGNSAALKACWGLEHFPIPHRPQPSSQPQIIMIVKFQSQ